MSSQNTPVIIGVGDIVNRSISPANAREPLTLMLDAILAAIKDTDLSVTAQQELQTSIDDISVVQTWTWPYPDLPSSIAQGLRCHPRHRHISDHGGNQPVKLLDHAARRIARGESEIAAIVGGEALASLNACAAAKQLPPPNWTKLDKPLTDIFSPTTRDLGNNYGARHKIGAPIHIYPLYEAGLRAHRQQSLSDNNAESAALYGRFADIAAQNPLAWSYGRPAKTAAFIGSPSPKNRMICSPYPLLMNAFNTVNIAGAVLVMSLAKARALGIPPQKCIYPLGGAGTSESNEFWLRQNYHSSPSISRSIDAALSISHLTSQDIDLYDFYSCFPIVPKLAARHLGLPLDGSGPQSQTLLGGLTSFGGAGNNYSMHAITEMVRQLRAGKGKNGLVLANGGWLTYQHVMCFSAVKPGRPYPTEDVLPPFIDGIGPEEVDEVPEGSAVIETYTVEFARSGIPVRGFVVGRLKESGRRFLANHADEATLRALADEGREQIGRLGVVGGDGEGKGRNVWRFDDEARL